MKTNKRHHWEKKVNNKVAAKEQLSEHISEDTQLYLTQWLPGIQLQK